MRPILFSIGSISVSSFGFFFALSFIVGTFLIWRQGRDERLSEEKVLDSVFATVIYGFIGARIVYSLANFDIFGVNLLRVFLIWKFPGLSFIGALLGGSIALFLSAKRKKFQLWQIFDIYSVVFLLVYAIASIGAMLDGAQVGTPVRWGILYAGFTEYRHPLGFYGAIFGVVSYLIFSRLRQSFEKQKHPFGIIFLLVVIVFSIFMFVLEFFKETTTYLIYLSINQLIYIGVFLASVAYLPKKLGRNILKDFLSIVSKTKINVFSLKLRSKKDVEK